MNFHFCSCITVYMFTLFLLLLIFKANMCLHPIDRDLDSLGRDVMSIDDSLDEFDSCDHVENQFCCNNADLCILQLNIRGECSKQSQLKQLIDNCVSERTPDIVILCKTWLTPFSPGVQVPGYDFCHKDRVSKRGGGVALLIANNIRYKLLNNNKPNITNPTFEHLSAKIELKNNQKLIVSSIYRPLNTPEHDFVDQYSNFVCDLKKHDHQGIIIGLDHNLDLLKSTKHSPTDRFISANLSLNLVPTITRPTHIMKSTATLIDNIFISQSWLCNFDCGILVNDMSDHLPSIVSLKNLKLSKKMPIQIMTRDTRTRNMKALKNCLSQINWSEFIKDNAPNESMSYLHDKVIEEVEHFTHIRMYNVNPKKARCELWLKAGIYISIRKCKKLYIATLHNKSDDASQSMYRTYAKLLQHLKRQAKLSYYGEKCSTYRYNTKKLWGIINEISAKQNDKSSLINCLKINNVLEYSASKITNKFGEYFSSVG